MPLALVALVTPGIFSSAMRAATSASTWRRR
jgi:hypothetical protein